MVKLRLEVQQRLRAVELIAYWEGRLVTNQLTEWFGISRQQASNDIGHYNSAINPEALIHSPAVKGYVPQRGFRPVLSEGRINEYIELVGTKGQQPMALVLETHPNIAAVQMPDRAVRPEVVREIVRACRSGESVRILYSSMSNPHPHERAIAPHTLVHTGFRLHVRAWCHSRQSFRDFLLSRIDRTPKLVHSPAPDAATDQYWHEQITLNLIPNTRLTELQKSLVERDFGMPEGRLQLRVRKALAHYTLQRYQAAICEEDAERVHEHPIQLLSSDRARLTPFLFSAEDE